MTKFKANLIISRLKGKKLEKFLNWYEPQIFDNFMIGVQSQIRRKTKNKYKRKNDTI